MRRRTVLGKGASDRDPSASGRDADSRTASASSRRKKGFPPARSRIAWVRSPGRPSGASSAESRAAASSSGKASRRSLRWLGRFHQGGCQPASARNRAASRTGSRSRPPTIWLSTARLASSAQCRSSRATINGISTAFRASNLPSRFTTRRCRARGSTWSWGKPRRGTARISPKIVTSSVKSSPVAPTPSPRARASYNWRFTSGPSRAGASPSRPRRRSATSS